MSATFGREPEGATPLEAEERDGLLPGWVSTREDLNRAEAENIVRARDKLERTRSRSPFWYLEESGLRELHSEMFGEVWSWAGTLRRRETNIGADPRQIAVMLRDLHGDVLAQIGDGISTAYPLVELAVRFHHRLVWIHPFPNGNGRHSRFAAELLLADLGGKGLTWGGGGLSEASPRRSEYLAALRSADRGEFSALVEFATRP
ncbi:MAG: mobile mystery protein B [Actinomycetota bacterium]|nr:mobile mystery protein B [Actinomycetota bacterium]